MGEIIGVAEELLDQRLVEAELLPDLLDCFLGRGGSGEIGGGIAGQRARQQESDDHDPDQARDRKHQPLADHGQHGALECSAPKPLFPPATPLSHAAHAFTSAR